MRVSQFDGYDDADSPKKNKVRPYDPPDDKPRDRTISLEEFRKCMRNEERKDGGLISYGFKAIYNRLYKSDGLTHYNSNLVSDSLKHWVKQGLIIKLESEGKNPQYYVADPYDEQTREPNMISILRKSIENNLELINYCFTEMNSENPENPKCAKDFYETRITDFYRAISEDIHKVMSYRENLSNESSVEKMTEVIQFGNNGITKFMTRVYEGKPPQQIKHIMDSIQNYPYKFNF
jgi:DNA-binding transcriptional regulator GbsR (MarR family)